MTLLASSTGARAPLTDARSAGEAPKKNLGIGTLRPTVVNTVGLTTRFSGRYPMKVLAFL